MAKLLTPTLAYRPAILFGLTLVFGWRGFLWSQVVFLVAFTSFFGWKGAFFITPLYLLSHAAALAVVQKLCGNRPWLGGERVTLGFLAGAFLAPALPALLSNYVLDVIGVSPISGIPPEVDSWLRGSAAILVLAPALLVHGSSRLRRWTGLPPERETSGSITGRNILELSVEIALWTATLWITVGLKDRYNLNVTYLTFLPPLAFTLFRGMRLATLALLANGIIASTLWIWVHWEAAISIGDLRLLILLYSVTMLVLAAVVDERQRGRDQLHELLTAEAVLRENERYFRTLADSTPAMIWVCGPDKLCTFCNKRWLEFTGHSLQQELGDGWSNGIHPDDRDRCIAAYVSSFDARREFRMEYRMLRADGEYRWIVDQGVPVYRFGEFEGYIGSCFDITEQRRATDRLRASEACLRDAQRLAKVGHWERNLESDTIQWSEEMIKMLGLEKSAALSFKDFLSHVHSKDRQRIIDCDETVHSTTAPIEVDYRIRRADGRIRYVRSIIEGVRDDRGTLVRVVGATQDVTDSVSGEEERNRIRASLAAAREDESRRIARDLHDDITQQLALVSVALGEAVSEPMPPEALAACIRSARKDVLGVCEAVRRISHQLHPSMLDDLGLSMALESLCGEFSEREGLAVWFRAGRIPVDIPLPTRSCLYRVTQEALRNVSKHAKAQEVSVSLARLGQTMQLCIADSGLGFDISSARTGLGLQSMRERVALVNGAFSIESRPGSGTRVVVNVPVRAERKLRIGSAP